MTLTFTRVDGAEERRAQVHCTLALFNVISIFAILIVKASVPVVSCKGYARTIDLQGLRAPQNRINMQRQDLTEVAMIGEVSLRSLRFSKALASLLIPHKQLSQAFMPIPDHEKALQ